jgi:FKBP-type peptidyl-prolyl cis-trans isomerase
MKRDQIVIFVLVGIMLFSAVATGLLLLAQGDGSDDATQLSQTQTTEADQPVCEASAEVAMQVGKPEGEWPTTVTSPVDALQQIDLRVGDGVSADIGNCITVHYRLSLADGTPIEGNDTFVEGTPIAFELNAGSLIEGWVQGIPGMQEGGFRRLIVPSALAYGDTERPGIPAGADLIFDVELVKVEY